MAKIPEYYSIGDREKITLERLLLIIEDLYKDLAVAINRKPDVYVRSTNGQASDTFLSEGDININENTLRVEMLVDHPTATTVTWKTL